MKNQLILIKLSMFYLFSPVELVRASPQMRATEAVREFKKAVKNRKNGQNTCDFMNFHPIGYRESFFCACFTILGKFC